MKQRNLIPNSTLDVEQNKFFAFPGGSSMILSNEMFEWASINSKSLSKYDMYISSKDEVYFYARKVVCKCCFNNRLHKHGFTKRTLRYVDEGDVKVKVQRYRCPKCGKTYQVDLSDIVDENANITHDLRNFVRKTFTHFFFSLNNNQNSLDVFNQVDLPRQTIQNIIMNTDCSFEPSRELYSGYYIFDVEWVSISRKWHYFFVIMDATTSRVINYRLYEKETSANVKEFLIDSIPFEYRGYITTDLDKKYGKVIDELGFKHQLCFFHFIKNCRERIRDLTRGFKNRKELIKESYKQLGEIIDVMNCNDSKKANEFFYDLAFRLDDFNPFMQSVIRVLIFGRYKKLIRFFDNFRIDRTSNKIENCFQKIMPRFKKKIYRTQKGFLTRVHLRIVYWNKNRVNT